jgi:tetratricopeptide (TPR) repeat protein
MWFVLSLFPLYFIVRRWRESSQRAQALFDYTLAESLRKGGDSRGALKLFDRILSHACSDDLLWRAHAGRSLALLARGDAAQALDAANKSLELAQAVSAKKDARAAKEKAAKGASHADEAEEELGPDVDPFLRAPISLALLHYQRGLIADGLGDTKLANADFTAAVALEPEHGFIEGYVARRQFEERLVRGSTKVDTEGDAPAAKGSNVNKRLNVSSTSTASSTNSPLPSSKAVKQPASASKTKAN